MYVCNRDVVAYLFCLEFVNVTIPAPTLPLQTYLLAGLRPYTRYELRARAANIQDDVTMWSDVSTSVYVTTDVTGNAF